MQNHDDHRKTNTVCDCCSKRSNKVQHGAYIAAEVDEACYSSGETDNLLIKSKQAEITTEVTSHKTQDSANSPAAVHKPHSCFISTESDSAKARKGTRPGKKIKVNHNKGDVNKNARGTSESGNQSSNLTCHATNPSIPSIKKELIHSSQNCNCGQGNLEDKCEPQNSSIHTDSKVCRNQNGCLRNFIDIQNRCDDLINGFQRQNQQYDDLSSSYARLKRVFFVMFIVSVVLILTSAVFVILTFGMVRTVDRQNAKTLETNITTSKFYLYFIQTENNVVNVLYLSDCNNQNHLSYMLALVRDPGICLRKMTPELNTLQEVESLKMDYMGVAKMINDLMTRTRTVVQLKSEGHFCSYGRSDRLCYMRWVGEGFYHQGDLVVSQSKDSVKATSGAFYVIYCKILFDVSVNSTKSIRLAFDILKRKRGTTIFVDSATQQFPAVDGKIRYALSAQTTMYLQPNEELLIGFDKVQQQYMATYHGAHVLSIFEIS